MQTPKKTLNNVTEHGHSWRADISIASQKTADPSGRSLAGIAGSNLAVGMDNSLLCVLRIVW